MSSNTFGPSNFILKDEPMAEYHRKWWWLSKSVIDLILSSPRHFHYKFLNPKSYRVSESKSQSRGTDVHTMLLELPIFKSRYLCGPEGKNRNHVPFKNMVTDNPDNIILPFTEYKMLEAIYDSVFQQKLGRYFLQLEGSPEVSCYWIDPEFNQLLKCRPDKLIESEKIVVDIKTTSILGKFKFERHASELNYHRSAALTLRGLKILTGNDYTYIFLVVETKPPFNVACYSYCEDDIATGNLEIDKAIKKYQECQKLNSWPGYSDNIQSISLPNWRGAQYE